MDNYIPNDPRIGNFKFNLCLVEYRSLNENFATQITIKLRVKQDINAHLALT
jgi:hypothetical protein